MRKNRNLLLAVGLSLLTCGCCQPGQQGATAAQGAAITAGEETRVTTTYGTIEGYLDGGIYTFKGVRYAKAARFMPPEEPDTFGGIRQCKLYGPKAMQTQTLEWKDNTQTDYAFGNQFVMEPMSEDDCLVLNVWTPSIKDGKKRPVFFWIHGGGYFAGSAHDLPCYEGRALAEKGDIVVVNINHRLNVLGYLDLTGLGGKYAQSVNLGMQDIVKALEWVKKNISRFGGDPANVTIGGQSGGGGKVSTLLAMPSAKGLFAKAIVQSGSTLKQMEKEQSQAFGLAVVKELGVDPAHPEKLNTFTYQELMDAGQRATEKFAGTLRGSHRGRVGYAPTVDGVVLPHHPFDGVAPQESAHVPMLIGTDFNEFTFDISANPTADEISQKLAERMGADSAKAYKDEFSKAYPKEPAKAMLYVDLGFRPGAVRQAALKSAQGQAPAYLYLFTWKPSTNALGASHGMELPFMFNNVALQREMTGSTDDAYKLQDIIATTWLQFIKTGNPNNKKLPTWEPYTDDNGITMILDNNCHAEKHHDQALLKYGRPLF